MTSRHYSKIARAASAALLCLALHAQTSHKLSVAPPSKLVVRRGETVATPLRVELHEGYHVNSNTPTDEYAIPLRLTWDAQPIEVAGIVFPKPKMESFAFSDKPISVFDGEFEITTRFRIPAATPPGSRNLVAKLRYQACNQTTCWPPLTLEVKLPVEIR